VAGGALADQKRAAFAQLRVAWPSGDWGSLPLDGGIEAANITRMRGMDGETQKALTDGVHAQFEKIRSPLRTAEQFGIEEIIDPRDTRALLCAWISGAYRILAHPDHLKPRDGAYPL